MIDYFLERSRTCTGLFQGPVQKSWPFALFILCLLTAVLMLRRRQQLFVAPRIGHSAWAIGLAAARQDFNRNGRALTKLGYERHRNSLYWMQTGDIERLVLPVKYVDELRKFPNSKVDSRSAVVERNLGWYNGVDMILNSTAHVNVCRTQLVQNLAKVTEDQVKDLAKIAREELLQGSETVNFVRCSATILQITNRVIAKTLVGRPLCYDEAWLRITLDAAVNLGLQVRELQTYPSVLRTLVNPFLTPTKILRKSTERARSLLYESIINRKKGDKSIDILQWLIDSNESAAPDPVFVTNQILFLAVASIRSTAASITNTLYDLIDRPDCLDALRAEIGECVADAGGWSLAAVDSMQRLDSFIKESQRLSHPLLLSFNRRIRKTITLADGLVLPAGLFVCTPAYWTARDPDYFEGGEEFRPWRWYDLRKAAERDGRSTNQYLASATSPENLHWGFGRSACPGRFMASAEMKLIIAWILRHYDICLPEGQSQKPASIFVGERVLPDPNQQLGFQYANRD